MLPILFYFWILAGAVESRDMLIRRACELEPTFSFCRHHAKTAEIRSESQKKRDVFLQWAYVSAKDDQDIEDVDELETTRKKPDRISDYCKNYAHNYNSYCKDGHLEKLEGLLTHFCLRYTKSCKIADKLVKMEQPRKTETVFPTPEPFFTSTSTPKVSYCDGNAMRYKMECEKEGFTPEVFCHKYKEQCGKLEKIDADTTKSVVDIADSLETPDEFEEHEKEEAVSNEKVKPEEEAEGQGVGTDEVTAYCTNYIENYNFYCVGDMVPEHAKFCNSYKKNCPDRVSLKQSGSFLGNEGGSEGSESSSSDDKTYLYKGSKKDYCEKFSVNYQYYCKGTIENAEIFTKFCPSYKRACVKDRAPADPFAASKGQIKSGGDSDFPDIEHPTANKKTSSRRTKKLKKRPCSADCDERIFPHCTKECKCDYDYPAVQKFCNPPPLPIFLNTCRLWYYGCPKYEQYHYASQFIYSKAEKGKVLEGPKQSTTFQLLAPSGETLPYKPASRRYKRDLVYWPESLDNNEISGNETVDFETEIKEENKNQTENLDKMVKLKNGTMVELVAAPPLPKNSSSRDDVLKDKKPPPDLPRVKKTTGGEAVPVYSDSVFSNALAQYNSLTDSRGILHRPRSRSPFTKPGLWEPNPDDPHNRDHANKYYYRPESVNVDWLQGQLAWGAHWAVPAAGVGGTDGFSAVHFPSIGTFLNIPDDYD